MKRRRKGDGMGFLSGEKLIVGYDLGSEYSQISFATSEDGETDTFSQVAGAEIYNIPTALCKKYGTNQWLYGREAVRCAGEDQGILVKNLLGMALDGETVVIDKDSFDPVALLALFLKRTLGMFAKAGGQAGRTEKIGSLMITCPTLDHKILEVLGCAVEGLGVKRDRIFFQSYAESFYNYMLHQPGELWTLPPVLFHYREDGIRVYRMECNRRTTPVVTIVKESEYAFPGPDATQEPDRAEELDTAFQGIAAEVCDGVGSVFLIGDSFDESWMKHSLRFLCKGRRVFQGNNLFSKGACCGMQERLAVSKAGEASVFLGKDKLKANIGMKILRQGENSYYALLDAGMNWYEAAQTLELYLQEGNELSLMMTQVLSGRSREVRILLDGLSGTPARLKLHLFMKGENCLETEVEDLGFGDFRAASGQVWKMEIDFAADMN